MKYRVAAILDFANMAAPVIVVFGALKKSVQYGIIYICVKFHVCKQISTTDPLRAWTIPNLTMDTRHGHHRIIGPDIYVDFLSVLEQYITGFTIN